MASSTLSDDRLAKRAAGGDAAAFEAIYERHHQPVYRYSLSILRDPDDAQDTLQSTMERALAGIGSQRKRGGLRSWLLGIAHNEAIDLIGRRPAAPLPEPEEVADTAAGSVADTALSATDRDRLRQLMSDLAGLPERQRAALVLRELSGLDSKEIGAALAISPAAAKQSVYEARVALTALAAGRDMSCDTVQQRLSAGDGRRLRGRKLRAHLRDCVICQAFNVGINARTADLPLLFAPLTAACATKTLAAAMGAAGFSGADAGAVTQGGPGAAQGAGDPAQGPHGAADGAAGPAQDPPGAVAASQSRAPLRDRRVAAAAALAFLALGGAIAANGGPDPITQAPAPARAAPPDAQAPPAQAPPAPPRSPARPAEAAAPGPQLPAGVAGYTQLDPSVTDVLSTGAGAQSGDGASGAGAGAASASQPGTLAFTGLDALWLAWVGVGLLGIGALMRVAARRART